MNTQYESYLMEHRRREQLADIDKRWQLVDLARSQEGRSFFYQLRTALHLLGQLRRIRIQVSFEVATPCPETAK